MYKNLYLLFLLTSSLLLGACGGGGNSTPSPAPPTTPTPSPSTLYIGYYTEDPLADPNDPTPGVLYLYLPDSDTAFTGEFFFSYVGCQGSTDTGLLDGIRVTNRSGVTVSGSWSGNVDGTISSGTFSGAKLGGPVFNGSWARNGGSQNFVFGQPPLTCSYTFAGNGDFTLYAVNNGMITIAVDQSIAGSPVFRFDVSNTATYFTVSVFDADCLAVGGGINSCFMWERSRPTTGGPVNVTYGVGGTPAQPLQAANYVVTVISADANGAVQDYGSIGFSGP